MVVLGLGSNQGNSRRILKEVLELLGREVLEELRQAPLYRTAPVGVLDQPYFLNTAAAGFFPGDAEGLLEKVQYIETAFGRTRSRERRWGERPLDIDILLFGNEVIAHAPVLEIPHPRLRERAFALIPLLDVLPNAVDPVMGQSYRAILEQLPLEEVASVQIASSVKCIGEYAF